MFMFALVLPLSASGLVYSLNDLSVTNADSNTTTNYYSGYMKEVNLTNNNFNSSTSTYSISTSLSGWTGQLNDKRTTAGIINTGNSFQNYMSGTYYLSNNPLAKASDKNILMINSKTESSKSFTTARQGYKSSSINLDANSFYSFQVSFKSDTNYESYTTYVEKGQIEEDLNISKATFENKGFDDYISFTYKSKQYYLHKTLSTDIKLGEKLNDVNFFYEDDEYVGFVYNDRAVYTQKSNVETIEVNEEKQNNILSDAQLFTCNIAYDSANSRYNVSANTKYYTTKTEYTSLNDYVFGSVYLDGLKDENGDPIKAQYEKITSKEWVTYYFFVATGNEAQTVTLDLWLGTNKANNESSGVVYFDDCHIYQYSENTFWKTYQSYIGKNYTQEVTNTQGHTSIETFLCSDFVDLRNKNVIAYPTNNFDFEEGIFNDDISSLKNWKKFGDGNAQIFNSKAPEYFKKTTGYDFVGSNLSCEAVIEDEKVVITANDYVLGLWADKQYVSVKSNDISINANEIYKVKAFYKIAENTNGNVYMFVEENDNVLSAYNLTDKQYTLTEQTASSAVTSNGTNDGTNNYGFLEFYVKGGALYNSSVNISLGLGKSGEVATGCVVFDDITVEKATTENYDSATNKIELDTKSGTTTVPNGNFNKVTIDKDQNYPLAPQNWTITNGNGINFGGVINTEKSQYDKYVKEYNRLKQEGIENIDNPYYWATYANPLNSKNSSTEPDNILMLSNLNKTWQKLQSDNMSLSANTTYRLNFKYKTTNISSQNATIKVSLYGKDGFKLFESQNIASNGKWEDFSIYLKSFAGASEIYMVVEFGNEDEKAEGFVYFDNFELNTVDSAVYENKVDTAEGNGDIFGIVDMSNFYLNLPTNNITTDLSTTDTPAYTGSVSSSDGNEIVGGIINSDKFGENSIYNIPKENPDDEGKDVFYITSQGVGSYTIQSNFTLDLEADKYYVLTFKLKTNFNYNNDGIKLDKDKKYEYGATFGLTGFNYMTKLMSSEKYETYSMYFKASEATSSKLYMGLVCDTLETAGSMAIYDITFEESDEDTYNSVSTTTGDKKYDVNKDRVFVAKAEESSDGDTGDGDTGDGDKEEPANQGGFDWLLVPTLITAFAILVAVVGSVLRKVKIKKIEKKRKETYDRKQSLNIDVIKQKAKKQRDAEVVEVKETIAKFEKELQNLETAHKQKVLSLRTKDKGRVSKETDKEFKLFAQKRTVIAEKIEALNKQVESLSSAEHLLSLERKIYTQEEMKQKELMKVSKKLNKEQEKSIKDKDVEKEDKTNKK